MTLPPADPISAIAGFPLSLTQAARVLEVTPDAVVDLVRAGHLGAYLCPATESAERPPLRFHPGALPLLATRLRDVDSDVNESLGIAAGLREYLAQRTPADSHRDAVAAGRPVLAKAKTGQIYAHINPKVLQSFLLERDLQGRRGVRLAITETVTNGLTQLGCTRMRGIRPIGDLKQVWEVWWRVPHSIYSLDPDDAGRVDDFPAFGGARESGEPVASDQDGPYIAGLM
jgi:hypothetical protein